ncbi:hypothetical protein PIB30_003123 [Stylosanthes scabra]|uniref:Uncharacterized protein n=1 Tax=Stylosanthes scabra TaxID=79078 RepID=A0ABU6Y3I5_9FABA|nr:hypothetical protein [Stylosanthes scabra]
MEEYAATARSEAAGTNFSAEASAEGSQDSTGSPYGGMNYEGLVESDPNMLG